ncbi:hypothetical protein CHCC20335_3650 [Bacillus paralicheniformis]|nr:hypothetical protein CHCC20335_3650 [Bacillus paralicheniformis]
MAGYSLHADVCPFGKKIFLLRQLSILPNKDILYILSIEKETPGQESLFFIFLS